jgi:hypothetical protein
MKKIFLSLALLLVGGAELLARCPYRKVQTTYVKRQRGGRPYRRLEARDTADEDADSDADSYADQSDDDVRPAGALKGKEYKDVELDAHIDADQSFNQSSSSDDSDADDANDMDLGDLDR